MKKLLLEGKEFMYAEERAKLVAEAKPWVLSMRMRPSCGLHSSASLRASPACRRMTSSASTDSPVPLPPDRPSMAAGSRGAAALPAGVTTAFHAGP